MNNKNSIREQILKENRASRLLSDLEKRDYESLLYAGVDEMLSIIRLGLQVLG